LHQISKRLTYANVMSSIAVFLVLGGATAFAASQLGKNSVGTKQLKSNAVTTAKIKKNAVTTAKIKNNAVTTAKIKDGAITGTKVNLGTLGTVPNSAKTDVVKGAHGTLSIGQEKTIFEYGPLKITFKCEPYLTTQLGSQSLISSSVDGSVFTSWRDGSSHLGPGTPEEERELSGLDWQNSNGPFEYENPSDTGVSASAPSGQAFNAFIGEATEKDTNTCWYFLTANIIS
jgi:hypothetical protein